MTTCACSNRLVTCAWIVLRNCINYISFFLYRIVLSRSDGTDIDPAEAIPMEVWIASLWTLPERSSVVQGLRFLLFVLTHRQETQDVWNSVQTWWLLIEFTWTHWSQTWKHVKKNVLVSESISQDLLRLPSPPHGASLFGNAWFRLITLTNLWQSMWIRASRHVDIQWGSFEPFHCPADG